jgi:DNA-binding PadR family transcriptional regulator
MFGDTSRSDAAGREKAMIEGRKRRRGAAGVGSLGRYADPAVLILTSLAGGDKHGYALVKDIESFGGVSLGPGTLYGAIARLEEEGLVEALPADDRRHPYRITGAGAAALADHVATLDAVARVARTHLSLRGALA